MMNAVKTAVMPSPTTTMLVRPSRSVRPAKSEPNAPIRAPKARVYTRKEKLMCSLTRNSVDTEPADVQLVVEHDGGEHRDAQVHASGAGLRVGVELPVPQPGHPSRLRHGSRGCHAHQTPRSLCGGQALPA